MDKDNMLCHKKSYMAGVKDTMAEAVELKVENNQLQAEFDKLELTWNKAIKQLDERQADIDRMARQIDEQNKEIKRRKKALDFAKSEIRIFSFQVEDMSEKGFALAEGINNKIDQLSKP